MTVTPTTRLGNHLECSDSISHLPDDVLGHMLSFLPTRLAVSTSILSTRWRYLFTLTTCLSFDDAPCFSHPTELERIESTQKFKEFVENVLKSHQISTINKFSLLCGRSSSYDNSDLNQWVGYALQKGVQELHYELPDQIQRLPDGFFTCETLTNLKLIGRGYNEIHIPASVSLPKLKILYMDHIRFFDFNSIERLFSSCELLEELTLKSCVCDIDGQAIYRTEILKVLTVDHCSFPLGKFHIDAPNLEYLTYHSNIAVKIVPSWKVSSSLVEAELTIMGTSHDYYGYNDDTSVYEYEFELLEDAAYKITRLRFEMESAEMLYAIGELGPIPEFHRLSRLYLNDCAYYAWKNVTIMLDKSPQLKTLVFESGFHCCQCSLTYCSYECYCDIPLDPFSCRAQVIEVRNFCGHKVPMLLTGHLLRNASALKNLIVYRQKEEDDDDDLDLEVELKMSRELLMLPRASEDCCLEMKSTSSL